LSICRIWQGDGVGARLAAEKSVECDPTYGYGFYSKACVEALVQLPERATQSIDEALRLEPGNADYHQLKAAIEFDRQYWGQAMKAADRGLRCDPNHLGCANIMAAALLATDRLDAAERILTPLIARNPEFSATHETLGLLHLRRGRHERAAEHFSEALRLEPDREPARLGAIEASLLRSRTYRAFSWLFATRIQNESWDGVIRALFVWPLVAVLVFLGVLMLPPYGDSWERLASISVGGSIACVFALFILSFVFQLVQHPIRVALLGLHRSERKYLAASERLRSFLLLGFLISAVVLTVLAVVYWNVWPLFGAGTCATCCLASEYVLFVEFGRRKRLLHAVAVTIPLTSTWAAAICFGFVGELASACLVVVVFLAGIGLILSLESQEH
jgi:tetratricopeptide (TPR) repeat protein